jgi:beta-phosphoglucomutase-like phosphatase (HAD superfamily)
VVIEDSLAGVQGAIAAGMRAVGFLGGQHIRPAHGDKLLAAGATIVAEDWPEIARWLSDENSICP